MNNANELLARLLAEENITVLEDKVQTASFDLKDRVLRLPIWENMTKETRDHMTGHEVGHALYTPVEDWEADIREAANRINTNVNFLRGYFNIVEDARIEKLVQRKYPGLRSSFIKSYRKLLADGFFGGDLDKINNYNLIDRINVYFKCGMSAGVRIEKDEQIWIDEIEKCETWEQVVDISERLFIFAKEKKEKNNEEDETESFDQEYSSQEDQNEDQESDEFENNSFSESGDSEDSNEENDEFDELFGNTAGGNSWVDKDLAAKTNDNLEENIRAEFNSSSYADVINISLSEKMPHVVTWEESLAMFRDSTKYSVYHWLETAEDPANLAYEKGVKLFNSFMDKNKRTINYMVKEFEMKKRASEYSRQKVGKTGMLDTVKMNNYKFSEDIFRRVTIVPEGKSHGMIMYVDWSGSMQPYLKETVEQNLILAQFCRQIGIPFRVYSFTTNVYIDSPEIHNPELAEPNVMTYSDSSLVELLSDKMNPAKFREMASYILAASSRERYPFDFPRFIRLGGTPLCECINGAIHMFNKFKKETRVDIVNTFFLTDGEGRPITYCKETFYNDRTYRTFNDLNSWSTRRMLIKLNDSVTKKSYRIPHNSLQQDTLLKMYRDRTGSPTIGYFVSFARKHDLNNVVSYYGQDRVAEVMKEMTKNGYATISGSGYDKYFIINAKNLRATSTDMKVDDDASKAKIRTAFAKSQKGRLENRKMLSELIEAVA
jgi:hypothetical protein